MTQRATPFRVPGRKVHELRQRAKNRGDHVTQKLVAKRLGMSAPKFIDIEKGRDALNQHQIGTLCSMLNAAEDDKAFLLAAYARCVQARRLLSTPRGQRLTKIVQYLGQGRRRDLQRLAALTGCTVADLELADYALRP